MNNNKLSSKAQSKKLVFNSPKHSPRLKISSRPKFQSNSLSTIPSPSHRIFSQSMKKRSTLTKPLVYAWAPEKHLNSLLSSLKSTFLPNLAVLMQLTEITTQSIEVVTTIDEFMNAFMVFRQRPELSCRNWIILSPAMNSKEVQANFNQMYAPIAFKFLADSSSLYNYFLHGDSQNISASPKMVADWTSTLRPQYSCIQQSDIPLSKLDSDCLHLTKSLEEYGKIQWTTIPYFIEPNDEFDEEGSIRVKGKKGSYCLILENSTNLKLKEMKLSKYQKVFKSRKQYRQILFAGPTHRYIEKFLSNHTDQSQILLFTGNLLKSENEQAIRQLQSMGVVLINSDYYNPALCMNQFQLINYAPRCYNQLNVEECPIDQVVEQMGLWKKVSGRFNEHKWVVKKTIVKTYNWEDHEHMLYHLIPQNGMKTEEINSLEELYESHKIMIIVGIFKYRDLELIQDYPNTFAVMLNPQPSHLFQSQLEESETFIDTLNRAYQKIYKDNIPAVQTLVQIVTSCEETGHYLKSLLKVHDGEVKVYGVNQFLSMVNSLPEMTKHIVIMTMEQFNEPMEKVITNIEWHHNHVSFELYIKYGEDFIFRNKEVHYKFIKVQQLRDLLTNIIEMHQIPIPFEAPEPIMIEEMKPQLDMEEPTSTLYICVHRSVPFHSFISRCNKVYQVLVYNKFEEVLLLARHLKEDQLLSVIAHAHSEKFYSRLCRKLQIDKDKVKITYVSNPSEFCIRNHIDEILHRHNLEKLTHHQPKIHKNFKGLVIYDSHKQKHLKIIKVLNKVFGAQLKLQFISESLLEEMVSHPFQFELEEAAIKYKLGNEINYEAITIKGAKSLFILAMHPYLQFPECSLSHLVLPTEPFISRILYDSAYKNYEIKSAMFQSRKILKGDRHHQKEGKKSKAIKKKRKSLIQIVKHKNQLDEYPIKLIKSSKLLKMQICDQFRTQHQLVHQLIKSQQSNMVSIVFIHESEFQTFSLLEVNDLRKYWGIIWVVGVTNTCKCLFTNECIVFCQTDRIQQIPSSLLHIYDQQFLFDSVSITSNIPDIPNVHLKIGQNDGRTLHLGYETQSKQLLYHNYQVKVRLTHGVDEGLRQAKVMNIGNVKMIKEINAKVCRWFRKDPMGSIAKSMGTLIICESRLRKTVRQALCEMKLENVTVRGYGKEELIHCLFGYSFCKTIIMVDSGTLDEYNLVCLPNCVLVPQEREKVKAILRSIMN